MPVRIAHGRSLFVACGLAAAFAVIANSSLQTAVAEGDTRTLAFHHTHTGEDIALTYKRNGRYDDAALAKLNWFMRDWRKDEETKMDPHLFDLLWEANREAGGQEPIQVICGYRSPDTNSMLRARSSGVAQFSLHTQGDAMDFFIPGVSLEKIREIGLRMQRGGVGFYPTSGSPFVHLDTGSVRHWPRMTHDQLVKVFPDERTVHVPSDGQPLAGYALALADVERQGNEPNRVSLASARNAGVIDDEDRTASAPQKKRGLLASLFGSRDKAQEVQEAQAMAPAKPVLRESIAVAQRSVEIPAPASIKVTLEHIVPLPKGRPVVVAAATPVPLPRPQMAMAHNPIAQRGLWPLEVASADPVATASLAYAAETAPQHARRAAPMGTALPVADLGTGAKTDRIAGGPASFDSRFQGAMQGPWLRAMILTPSVSAAMTTTRLGALDVKPLADFMRTPSSTLVMTFAEDPHYGMTTDSFSGSAVVFLATATFGMRTASLAQ